MMRDDACLSEKGYFGRHSCVSEVVPPVTASFENGTGVLHLLRYPFDCLIDADSDEHDALLIESGRGGRVSTAPLTGRVVSLLLLLESEGVPLVIVIHATDVISSSCSSVGKAQLEADDARFLRYFFGLLLSFLHGQLPSLMCPCPRSAKPGRFACEGET